MGFFTRCCTRLRLSLLALLAGLLMAQAGAAGIRLESAAGLESEGRLALDARYVVSLDAVHENALLAGVPLVFAVEFTLTKPRWYWAWRRMADWFNPTARIEYKLSYHALTRSYRVGVGTLYQSYDTLSEALRGLGVVRDWQVAERGSVTRKLDSRFAGELTMRLDTSRLPKPLQLSLLGDDWTLESATTAVEFGEAK
ncbi:DUF4390 domain-containing protein [Chitinimonas koreensis]|uniref:DUF4390 domain-containing protein n=1 Tax=Chitinimonas koreensis TaxID=356302 RepID=UPI00048A92A5|nr:DUF4390 domain-containing protein [Chitinimonas koreensis]QNM96866.1 DUF4390 domain-containing protein [Chitinimonas koreensis]